MCTAVFLFLYFLVALTGASETSSNSEGCDTIEHGYRCDPGISRFWGQYSPYFSVPSDISEDVSERCEITFAQVLSRHGARDPTASKTAAYKAFVDQLKQNVKSLTGKYEFLNNYEYALGADQLSAFGQQSMINSGIQFFDRYRTLAAHNPPFIRASGQDRVVESAQNWTQGFHEAKSVHRDHEKNGTYSYNIEIIPETSGFNNTLSHGTCTAFENGPDSNIGSDAQTLYASRFVPPIQARLNRDLPGANISEAETIFCMDLCPFNTVASPTGQISPFCHIFSEKEWHQYDYYQTLGKWYGYGPGNPLGPSQGVGYVNELIARLTHKPVTDSTNTNHTLDSNETTFPIGNEYSLFADFSHDNDMTGILGAFGFYNSTAPLSNTSIETAEQMNGYSAAWTVPFGARIYFEKMSCGHEYEELVRVIVNDRVVPLQQCGADELGRCSLDAFLESLAFARSGGDWEQCFV